MIRFILDNDAVDNAELDTNVSEDPNYLVNCHRLWTKMLF